MNSPGALVRCVWVAPGGDVTDAYTVRDEVFVDEQGFSLEIEHDDIDAIAHHVVYYRGNDPMATARIFPDEEQPDTYIAGRIAVRKPLRGTGLGRVIMEELERKARQLGAAAITLGAQRQAEGFYARCGYTAYGEEYMDEHCPHIHMKKELR